MSRKDIDSTPSYVELSTEKYNLFVDAFASANQRALGYFKSVWEVASRPYASTALETTVRENFDRANQMVALTISELQTSGAKNAEFVANLGAHNAKVQDAVATALRGLVTTGISNVNYVKETTTQQFEDLTKRLDEMQSRATASVNSN